jgi:hypothetical protein
MSINKKQEARKLVREKMIQKGGFFHTPIEMAPALSKAQAEKKAAPELHTNHEADHDESDKSSEASAGT